MLRILTRTAATCILILTLMSLSGIVVAQTTGAAILVGTVTDTTGAVVPGAVVNVVNVENQFVSNGVTNDQGRSYIPNLIPGT